MYNNCKMNNNNDMDNYYVIDMRSDTVSKPTKEMRNAMANAIVGDDVYGEDPTVIELENRSAKLFGKEAGLFVPTGTMANLLAMMVHCNQRGTEAIVGDLSHTFLYEQANAAQIAGIQLNIIKNKDNGTFCLNEMKKKIRFNDIHEPITSLVIVENTHNMCGGKILPLKWLQEVSEICNENNIPVHMDGARVLNASEQLKILPSEIAKYVTSLCFCLSKGLSAPVGSVLVGTNIFIKQARRLRKALGGGMRQVGILAAAGIVALDTIVPKLRETHVKLREVAEAINDINSEIVEVDLNGLETNILLIKIIDDRLTSEIFAKRLLEVKSHEIKNGICDSNGKGISLKVSSRNWEFARMVIYNDITDLDIELAIKKICYVINEFV